MTESNAANPPDPPTAANPPDPPAQPDPSLEERTERWSQDVERAGERFGQQVEDAGRRLASHPAVAEATDTAARVWGLLLLGVGLWFFAEVTLGYDMPSIPWRDIWPLGLIVIGLAVVVRGLRRRNA